jgi:hypothetical protein
MPALTESFGEKKKKKTKAQRLRRKEILRFFSGVIMV